jgi:hypothetical protein
LPKSARGLDALPDASAPRRGVCLSARSWSAVALYHFRADSSQVTAMCIWTHSALRSLAATPAVTQPDPAWSNIMGAYRGPWDDKEIAVVNGELVMMDPRADDPKGSLLKLTPIGKNKFKILPETTKSESS